MLVMVDAAEKMASTDRGMQASERELPAYAKQNNEKNNQKHYINRNSDAKAIVLMELLIDKLKLLKYEQKFCKTRSPPWGRLHKFYFAVPSPNRNEQFIYFASLVAWLYSLVGVPFPTPSENDDPNPICSNILLQLREVGFAPPAWSPSKLKQGYGDAVCSVLDSLVDLVLEIRNFQFLLPTYTDLGKPIVIDEIGKETADEVYVFSPVKTKEMAVAESIAASAKPNYKAVQTCWKLELERLAPQLRVSLVPDGKEWRTHLEQAQHLHMDISKSLMNNNAQLQRVEGEISSTLEKLQSREKFINSQIEPLTTEYSAVKRRLSEVQQKYGNSLDNVTELTNEIAHISEQIEQVKQMTVDKGNMISDVSPLVQIKSAIQKLKVELRELEVRIGVLQHTLLQVGLKQARKGHGLTVL